MSCEVVPLTRTGTPTANPTTAERRAWVRSRHRELVAVLRRRLGVPLGRAWWAAVAILTHWALESGWGKSEWNYNVGNIRADERCGSAGSHLLQGGDDGHPRPYRAYRTMEDGVGDTFELLLKRRYARVTFELLGVLDVGDAVAYYRDLMHAGWHPYSDAALTQYRGVYTTVAGWVGEPDSRTPALIAAGALLATWLISRR